jgi:hypothetical protein
VGDEVEQDLCFSRLAWRPPLPPLPKACIWHIEEPDHKNNGLTFWTYVSPPIMAAKPRARKDRSMGIRNQNREILKRLDSKTLEAKFLTEIEQGLNCSPFEAEAVLEVVKEVYCASGKAWERRMLRRTTETFQ